MKCEGCLSDIDFEHDGPDTFARCPLEEVCFGCERWFHPDGTTLRQIRDEDGGRRCPHCRHFFCRECGRGHELEEREANAGDPRDEHLESLRLRREDAWPDDRDQT